MVFLTDLLKNHEIEIDCVFNTFDKYDRRIQFGNKAAPLGPGIKTPILLITNNNRVDDPTMTQVPIVIFRVDFQLLINLLGPMKANNAEHTVRQ